MELLYICIYKKFLAIYIHLNFVYFDYINILNVSFSVSKLKMSYERTKKTIKAFIINIYFTCNSNNRHRYNFI